MDLHIDLDRVHGLEKVYAVLDLLEACYGRRLFAYQTIGPLVPQTTLALRQAMQGMRRALDIGCGDGELWIDGHPTGPQEEPSSEFCP